MATNTQPVKGASVPAPTTVPAKRGRPQGSRGPSREPEVVFHAKMVAAYKSATRLLEKLQTLARHRAIQDNGSLRARYNQFVTTIGQKVESCRPADIVIQDEETLEAFMASAKQA